MHQEPVTRLRPSRIVVLLALGIALRTPPVSADAPIEGADKQYENFTATDKDIHDHFTQLTWERPASATPYAARMNFAAANVYCANGFRRLPTLKELLTLVDEEPHLEYDGTQNTPRMIDSRAFPRTPPEAFWTSSPEGSGYATVDFKDGRTGVALPDDVRRIRCVR
jgi:hypothetical protein